MYYIKSINKTKTCWRTTVRVEWDDQLYDILKFDTLQEVIKALGDIKIKVWYDWRKCDW